MDKGSFETISFYIVAHADDWQLFMQPNAFKDLVAPGNKTIFIITTAGDAGNEEKYWSAREDGTKSSIRFCLAPLTTLSESMAARSFNSHAVHYWSCNNATCYFLRLPDGGLDGTGFSRYHHQSLTKLREDQISKIIAVDKSTTYNSYSDFETTLEGIILFESAGISTSWINYLNPCTNANPHDHADHYATGKAISKMSIILKTSQALFTGYSVRNNTERLNEEDYFWKAAMLAAYEKAVFDCSGYSTLKESIDTYLDWCSKPASFFCIND